MNAPYLAALVTDGSANCLNPPATPEPQLAVAGVIIGLVAYRLENVAVQTPDGVAAVTYSCLLGKASNGATMCQFAYGFTGVSFLITGALCLTLFCACNAWGLRISEAIFALTGTIW